MRVKQHFPSFLLILLITTFANSTFSAETGNAHFTSTYFSGSGVCAYCHNSLVDSSANDVSIETHWSTSMMANATRDPYWRAKVASELHRNPALSDEINDKCSRCHAPMANDSALKTAEPPQIFTEGANLGFLDASNTDYFDQAMDGVSCTLCHQISDNGKLGSLEGISGKYEIPDYIAEGSLKADRPIYGQYDNVRTNPMINNVKFTPMLGSHATTSEACATCHDLKTPFVDAEGNLASPTPESEFPEQMVYSEWNHSAYAVPGGPQEKRCQDCHMPLANGNVKIANRPNNLSARPGFARHTFHGANTVMMDMLKRNATALGVSAPAARFDTAIAATRTFLQGAGSIEILSQVVFDNRLDINLRVRNLAGHKLPSGYPSRRSWVHFTLKDADTGDILFESGKLNANGSIVGANTDADSSTYENHHRQITTEEQVQIYEPIMANTDDAVTHTLLRAAYYIKDNRLLPAGFDKASAPADVAVRGAAATDPDFIAGQDDIIYSFDLASLPSKLRIEAELRYQPLAFGHLQDLFQDSSAVTEVNNFQTLFDDSNTLRSELIASASLNDYNPTATCSGTDIPLYNLTIQSDFSCSASSSIAVSDSVVSGTSGSMTLTAPEVRLHPGTRIQAPATLSISAI